jgi:hypothetical protein
MEPTVQPQIILTEEYVRVECDLKDDAGTLIYPGFWIEARKNMTIGERMVMVNALEAIDDQRDDQQESILDRAEQIDAELAAVDLATPEGRREKRSLDRRMRDLLREQRHMLNEATVRQQAIITPYIRAWNIHDGDGAPLPPPMAGGAAALDDVFPDLVRWMIAVCQTAYRMGKGLGTGTTSGESPVPTPEPSSAGPQVVNTSPTRRSRKKS